MTFSPDKDITLLAFDFGTQKIGVAVGQTLTQTATALPEIKAKEGQPNWDEVAALLKEWQPDAFVVGVPVMMDGSEFEITHRARKFGKRLHGRFGKPCFEMDERLTSFDARDQVRSQNDKRALVDSVAASIILESWFREQWPELNGLS